MGELRTREVKWLTQGHGASRSLAELAPLLPSCWSPSSPSFTHCNPKDLFWPLSLKKGLDPTLSLAPQRESGCLRCAPWLQGGSRDGARSELLPDRAPSAADCIITHPLSSLIAPTSLNDKVGFIKCKFNQTWEREKIKVTWNKRNGSACKPLLLFLGGDPRPALCSRQQEAVEATTSQGEADPGSSPPSSTCWLWGLGKVTSLL